MKKRVFTLLAFVLSLILAQTLMFSASAADYEKEFNFLDESTYKSSLVYTAGMKIAGNSTTMGYKGWLGSAEKSASSVFVFEAAEGKVFDTLTIAYRGYSIASGAPDGVKLYVSTVGEADYAAGYTEANWTLVGALINDSTAGTGVNAADPANRDPELVRTVDVSAQASGQSKIFLRIDFYRSANMDGLPATYFAPKGASGSYATAPVVTEAPATEAPVVTEAPTTDAPVVTEAPVVTDTPATEAPVSPDTGDSISGIVIAVCIAAVVSAASVTFVSRKRRSAK